LYVLRGFKFLDSLELGWVGLDSVLGDNVFEEIEGVLVELALFHHDCTKSIVQGYEYYLHMLHRFIFVFEKHKDIVKLCHAGMVNILLQYVDHEVLQSRGCSTESEGHCEVLVVSLSCSGGSIPLISFTHADLVGSVE
jgi:hypothetical protein